MSGIEKYQNVSGGLESALFWYAKTAKKETNRHKTIELPQVCTILTAGAKMVHRNGTA
jgi:hypothetical protein